MKRWRRSAAVLTVAFLPFGHAGRWITDQAGRVVVMHGVNLVAKTAASRYEPAGLGFGPRDAAFLRANGFNVVRLGVIYQALEPSPGHFDRAYLNSIAGTQALLARNGIESLIDLHDDSWGPRYGGEGFPLWATPSGSSSTAWDDFWANDPGPSGVGLQDYYAAAWRYVAARFARTPDVLGYDVINEPNPGALELACLNPIACPLDHALTTFYARVLAQIRRVDKRHLVWVEPNLLYDSGGAEQIGSLGDPEVGFTFHVYCVLNAATGGTADLPVVCPLDENLVFQHAAQQSAQTGDALFMSEFGSTPVTALITRVADEADANMMSWAEWTLTTNGSTDFKTTPSLIENEHLPPTGANVNRAQLDALVRPYPQVIAGTPRSWSYTAASKTFTLSYSTARADGRGSFAAGSFTAIELPALVYPNGYRVTVTGATVASRPRSSQLLLQSRPGAAAVSVTVTPRSATAS